MVVSSTMHSFKNRTGPAVQPEKTGTSASAGFFSALDRMRRLDRLNRTNHGPTAGSGAKPAIRSNRLYLSVDGVKINSQLAGFEPTTLGRDAAGYTTLTI
jgi:hypothetical protein